MPPITIDHPLVGETTLDRDKLITGDTMHALVLAIYDPTLGSDNADNLALLASLRGTEPLTEPG